MMGRVYRVAGEGGVYTAIYKNEAEGYVVYLHTLLIRTGLRTMEDAKAYVHRLNR